MKSLTHFPLNVAEWLNFSAPPWLKMVGENLLVYSIAGIIIWWESRGISLRTELNAFENANLWWFISGSLGSFFIWFLGENLLFARLFTIFHRRTGYFELLPATAAAYFLQSLNPLVSSATMVLFLHQRKQVRWLMAGFTMTFFGFIDGILFSAMITLGGLLDSNSPVRAYIPFSGAAFAIFVLIAAWWMWRTPKFWIEKWLYDRPSLKAFREARLPAYAELLLIRFFILAPQGILLWVCLRSFHLTIPMREVVVISPAVLAAGGVPIAPAGLGPMQIVAVHSFAKFAPATNVMAAALAFSIAHLLYRLPLGLGAAHTFVSRVLSTGGHVEQEGEARRYHRPRSGKSLARHARR